MNASRKAGGRGLKVVTLKISLDTTCPLRAHTHTLHKKVTGDILLNKIKHGCPLRGSSFIAQYPGSDGSVTIAGGRGQFLCSVYIAGRDKAGGYSRKDVAVIKQLRSNYCPFPGFLNDLSSVPKSCRPHVQILIITVDQDPFWRPWT